MSARTVTLGWVVLVVLTLMTWICAHGHGSALVIGALIALAGVKMYLILDIFMGVGRAPAFWHAAAIAWVVTVVAVIGSLAWRTLT
jgi:heme/copper-type cytochrome/quinol oxidase subunit 4